MRLLTLGDSANSTALEDEAELITDPVADDPMKTKSFAAVYIVTRVSSEGCTVKTWLKRAR
jgi:hypothetical protein